MPTAEVTNITQYPTIEFFQGNVPVRAVAKAMHKSEDYIREGIKKGWLPIGVCPEGTKSPYISPKLLWEFTGFLYKGDQKGGEGQ